jgi:hypothetical protein
MPRALLTAPVSVHRSALVVGSSTGPVELTPRALALLPAPVPAHRSALVGRSTGPVEVTL